MGLFKKSKPATPYKEPKNQMPKINRQSSDNSIRNIEQRVTSQRGDDTNRGLKSK
jgi:hypothetical protein